MPGPTTRDIAKAAGVSQSTVSLVLNGGGNSSISAATRDKVLRIAREIGYVNRRRQPQKACSVALIVPTLTNLFYPQIAQTAQEYALEKGIPLAIYNTMRDRKLEEQTLKRAFENGADGIMFAYTPMTDISHYSIPMILVGEKDESLLMDAVGFSSIRAGEMVAEHLIGLGYKNFAFFSGPLDRVSLSRRRRFEGVVGALHRHGLKEAMTAFIDEVEVEQKGHAYEFMTGKRMIETALKQCDMPLAAIAVNDMTAWGVAAGLLEAGIKIPEQVAVCGFDNILLSQVMVPRLTTVDHLSDYRVRQALDILTAKIVNNDPLSPNLVVNYEPRIIVRESSQRLI